MQSTLNEGDCFLFVKNLTKLISVIMIALIEDKSEYSQCGAKLSIYVKNENINTQKIFLNIYDLVAAEG